MITIVVHWVPEPKLSAMGRNISIGHMMGLLGRSAPGYRKVFLTDQDGPSIEGWERFVTERHDTFVMQHMMKSRVNFLRGTQDRRFVFCDADTLIMRPLEELFEGYWSMAVPWRVNPKNPVNPRYFCGVHLVRDRDYAMDFYQDAHDRMEPLSDGAKRFGADMSVTKEMIIEYPYCIEKMDIDKICLTSPDSTEQFVGWTPGDAYIVNFKGTRKRFMKHVFETHVKQVEHAD